MILDNPFERMVLPFPQRGPGVETHRLRTAVFIRKSQKLLQPQEVQQQGNIYDQDMSLGLVPTLKNFVLGFLCDKNCIHIVCHSMYDDWAVV